MRLIGPVDDMPAAYAVSSVVVSAAIQAEGLQRAILEAQAMERPVIVSDLGAGPDVVLSPPMVSEDRMTGLRFSAGDDAALAAALVRLFSMPAEQQRAIGQRGRDWVTGAFQPAGRHRSDAPALFRSRDCEKEPFAHNNNFAQKRAIWAVATAKRR